MRLTAIAGTVAALRRKAGTWRRMPLREKLWMLPAILLLGMARAAVLTFAFRRVAPWLGLGMKTAAIVPLASEREIAAAVSIGRAVRTAARYTPWESKCLAQAIAARVLLGINGLPYALFLGVNTSAASGLDAHAWVCTGRAAVTGGDGFGQFAVVGTFVSPTIARRA